ncbi:putative tyramine receptor 2 [Patiria miniata]|uniref:G-protein coupled receptors family 1 profile domain-containing protein n=1 Tax=Patiria miniata TaxID=46514 RepID=A0A914B5R3_PATMI|nr:putative tyramine receptor 2 [Patiria miniata]
MENITLPGDGNFTVDVAEPDIGLTILKITLLTPIIICGIIGNLLVCISVFKFRNLRIVANYFIVSLAIADLAVSSVVMPLGLYQEVVAGQWYLGPIICDVWVSMDVLTCTSSIWNLCVISVDRFLAITRPIQYAIKRTPIMSLITIISAWGLSFLISIPALVLVGGYDAMASDECQLNVSPIFQVGSSCLSFYVPCFVLLIVYYKIFRSVQKLGRRKPGSVKYRKGPAYKNGVGAGKTTLVTKFVNEKTENFATLCDKQEPSSGETEKPSHDRKAHEAHDKPESRTKRISVARERKATSVLAIVVTVFICCWLPFFITNVVIGLCPSCNITHTTFATVTWLGWVNSAANPVIYTIFNREFRNAFKRLLFCCASDSYMRRQYLSTLTNY